MLSLGGRSCQFGRTSAPTIPQPVQTIRGPKDGTGTASPNLSTFMTALWWQSVQLTQSERTPCARMLRKSIGGPR
jgi:hypothetical protein